MEGYSAATAPQKPQQSNYCTTVMPVVYIRNTVGNPAKLWDLWDGNSFCVTVIT